MFLKFISNSDLERCIKKIDVEKSALPILIDKANFKTIYLKEIKTSWANIIKQEMLAAGGDAAISRNSYNCKDKFTDVLLMGTKSTFKKFIFKMKMQPVCFQKLSLKIEKLFKYKYEFVVKGKSFNLKNDFLILGILNLTPDSFSDGGKFNSYDAAMKRVEKMLSEGANIIDIGGESTRPGAKKVDSKEELERIDKVIKSIKKNFDVLVSVDTYKPKVVSEVLNLGIDIINDVSGGKAVFDNIEDIIAKDASVLVMMNKSKLVTGASANEDLKNPEKEFCKFYEKTLEKLSELGLDEKKIICDPGIGFNLSKSDVTRIIKNAKNFNFPACFGLSRKSYLSSISNIETIERDMLSNSISLYLMLEGVKIFRTHDVKGLMDTIKFYKTLKTV